MVWFGDRKRAQKEKDEKLKDKDKDREEEQALLLQQQKELEKAAADAASKDQQVFVVPGDATLLQYISQCVERIRPLSNTQQQASALAQSAPRISCWIVSLPDMDPGTGPKRLPTLLLLGLLISDFQSTKTFPFLNWS